MEKYFLHGSLKAQEGKGSQLAEILLKASELVSTAKGCNLYVISVEENSDEVFVTEIWDSKEDHDNSLNVEGVKELIMQAMPLLSAQPEKGQELKCIGGFGVK